MCIGNVSKSSTCSWEYPQIRTHGPKLALSSSHPIFGEPILACGIGPVFHNSAAAKSDSARIAELPKGGNLIRKVILLRIAMPAAMRLFPSFVIGQAIRIELVLAAN
jgi:hypothetical protein